MNAPRIALAASISVVLGLAGCKGGINGDTTTQETAQVQYPAQDPAGANVAPVSYASDNTGAPPGAYRHSRPRRTSNDSESEPRSQYSADEQDQDPYAEPYSSGDNYGDYSDYDTPVEYAPEPPPPLPDYAQPPAPGDDYMWTPGYWNYDNGEGYYWVPGAWVLAPYVGALWTPGWWGYDHERYGWHRGFWGRHIGYYGGINYGRGYEGRGYEGGYWRGDHFCYNRTVNNVNTTIVKNVYVYNVTKINNRYINNTHISYNGGRGGIVAQPRPREIAAYHEQHNAPMTAQLQMAHEARSDRLNFVRVNNGRPQAPVVGHPLSADNNVRPPAILNYQAMRQQPNEPQRFANRPQQNQPPVEFHNNVHPIPAGSHMAPENPPAPRAPYSAGGRMPQPPVAAPQESRRPVEQRPFAPERPVPMRPPVPQPQPMRPAPPPQRPAPQRPETQRPAPPPERRSESPHPAPPQHPSPNKRPEEHKMR